MDTGRRTQLLTYLLLIAINLMVVPNWFSPGRIGFGPRVALIALNVAVIAFCAWKISQIFGVSPFTRRKHPTYEPYEPGDEDDDEDERGGRRGALRPVEPRAEPERHWGQSGSFQEFDPYDEAADPEGGEPTRGRARRRRTLGPGGSGRGAVR